MAATSLYFHIPFCNRRCGYCDFNTFAGMKTFIPQYVQAICKELEIVSQSSQERISVGTVFFGGGTPSLLSVEQFRLILKTVKAFFDLAPDAEITLEANPGTVSKESLTALKACGFNRISFGMQSANVDDLRILNRQHRHEDVIQAMAWSKKVGFEHINLDLIFGIPGQTLESWQRTLELALMEKIDHFSLYSLIVEDGTPLERWISHGLLDEPDNDLAAGMYETAMQVLEKVGYEQYEISNWALKSKVDNRCRHNLQYWRGLSYLGFGAGAHGFFNETRTENASGIEEFINSVNRGNSTDFPAGPGCIQASRLSLWDRMQEFLMVGFRLTSEGISEADFKEKFGYTMKSFFSKQIEYLEKNKLIERHPHDDDRLRLTQRGILLGNQVFAQFVGNREPAELKGK